MAKTVLEYATTLFFLIVGVVLILAICLIPIILVDRIAKEIVIRKNGSAPCTYLTETDCVEDSNGLQWYSGSGLS